jgi:hypothetical protein
MSKSAFEQKQVGNASEVAAGSVQEATALETAAGVDVGSTGAKLFVAPSKMKYGVGSLSGFTAYENITAGDLVGISTYTPFDGVYYDNTAAGDANETDISNTTWWAQRFTVPATNNGAAVARLYSLSLLVTTNTTNGFTVRVRSSLTGADIATAYTNVTNYANVYTMIDIGLSASLLIPGNTYYIILHETGVTDASLGWKYSSTDTTPPAGSEVWKSTDSGANWSQQAGRNMIIKYSGTWNGSLGYFNVFKSYAGGGPVNNTRFAVAGVALNDALAGEPVTISNAFSQDIFTGLTPDTNYYLSESVQGGITTTPGTYKFWIGRSVGTTKIVRPPSMPWSFPIYVNVSSAVFHFAAHLEVATSGAAPYHYYRINPGQIGYGDNGQAYYNGGRGGSFPMAPGDRIDVSASYPFYIYPLIQLT